MAAVFLAAVLVAAAIIWAAWRALDTPVQRREDAVDHAAPLPWPNSSGRIPALSTAPGAARAQASRWTTSNPCARVGGTKEDAAKLCSTP